MVVVTSVVLASSSLVAFTAEFQSRGARPLPRLQPSLCANLRSHNGPQSQYTVALGLPCSEPQPRDSGLLELCFLCYSVK